MTKLTEEEIEDIAEICVDIYDRFNVPREYFKIKDAIIAAGYLKPTDEETNNDAL